MIVSDPNPAGQAISDPDPMVRLVIMDPDPDR